MQSIRLWNRIQHPDENAPLYRYLRLAHLRYQLWSNWHSPWVSLLVITGAIVLSPIFTFVMPIITVTIIGTYWAAIVAGQIQQERQQYRVDLLAVLPGGTLAVYRTLMTVFVRRGRILEYVIGGLRINRVIGIVLVTIVSLSAALVVVSVEQFTDLLLQHINLILTIGIFFTALYIEQMQAIALSCLVAMMAPIQTSDTISARLWAGIAFITIQILLYTSGLMLTLTLTRLVTEFVFRSTLVILLTVGFLIGIRELIIWQTWRRLLTQLGEPIRARSS